jgi:predicted Zn-dependent protease with MMP-like domain
VLWNDSRRVGPKMATASAMWLRVSSWAATWRLRASWISSAWVTSVVQTATPPPSSGSAVTFSALRCPPSEIQRVVSRRSPRLAASLAMASAPLSSDSPRLAASPASRALTAASQALLAHCTAPSAPAIQAGSARASRKAARRAALGRAVSSPGAAVRRNQARAPAARPSTDTTPFGPRASKAQGSPRSNSARSRAAWSGSARMMALTMAWASAAGRLKAAAQASRFSSPEASRARPSSITNRVESKASAEAWAAAARPSTASSRSCITRSRRSIARRCTSAHSTAQIARQTAPAVAATISSICVMQDPPESWLAHDKRGGAAGRLAKRPAGRHLRRMTFPADALAPSLDDFARIARTAFDALPDPFRQLAGEAVIRVADFAEDDVLAELGIEEAFELTGLYQGVDLSRRSVLDPLPQPSMVFLYRRPILDEWAERGNVTLGELITHVLVHEIGHHFGLSDDAIDAIEASE